MGWGPVLISKRIKKNKKKRKEKKKENPGTPLEFIQDKMKINGAFMTYALVN